MPTLTTIETFPLLTSPLSSYIPYPLLPPSALAFLSILRGVVRRARETRSWAENKQRTVSHTLCHTRPPYIDSPYAARAYHALFVVRLELCSQPSVIDSLPRPAWRLPSRRPPLTMPILPPPATRIDNSPTKTRANTIDTPAPPKPVYRPRAPLPTCGEDVEASPPPTVLEYTWNEDIYESLLPLWLEWQARLLDLWKRLRAHVSVRKWLLRFRGWKDGLELPPWEASVGIPSGFVAGLLTCYRFKRRPSRRVKRITELGRRGVIRYKPRPPLASPLPPAPLPSLSSLPAPALQLTPASHLLRPSPPSQPQPRLQSHVRIAECMYKILVQGCQGEDSLFYRRHRSFRTRGFPGDWKVMERQAWDVIDRAVWIAEVTHPLRRDTRYDIEVIRTTTTFDMVRQPDGTYHQVEVRREDDPGTELFNSLEEIMAGMPACYRPHEWNVGQYWSAPDSPTPSRPQTPLPEDREPDLLSGPKVKIVEKLEVDEAGVDPNWEERVRRGELPGESRGGWMDER